MRVECNECKYFIEPIQEDSENLLSKILVKAKCELGNRVMFRKPKTIHYTDIGGYFRNCKEFK